MAKIQNKIKRNTKTKSKSFDDRYQALEESQKLTGLSEEEFHFLLKGLSKASEGYVAFYLGDITLSFQAYGNKIMLDFEVENAKTRKTIRHKFTPRELGITEHPVISN